ncbi:MAG: glycosyl hydrolase [Gemmatimonadetes bacterium]|nr:glycosyl hydrolase [Gemmatimonadota bacterium]
MKSLQGSAGGSTGGGNVVWYRFDEGNGKVVEDASGKGRHGTVNGPLDGRRHPGFLSAYPETQFVRLEEFATYGGNQGIWAPYYTLHKIMAGLIDAHSLTGNQQALGILTGIGDWVHSRLAPLRPEQLDRMFNIYIAGEYGGVNESLAQLNVLRPKPEYVAAARAFDNRNVKVPTQENRDILDGRHANQHIPQFIGYLRLFEQSDVPEYYAAAQHFWDMVVPHRIYSHGGVGVGEMFRARDVIAGSLWQFPNDHNHAETCPLYNMLKLSRNLFFHEPDPKYMNYYEHGLFNQMLASRRDVENEDSPEVTYFVPVRPGERREYGNTGTCCGGTGMENHTKYQDSIYFRSVDDGTLYVNLYIPSTLDWKEKGFTIAQATRFPFEGASTLTVNGSGPLTVMLRVPVWATRGFTVRVNGKAEQLAAVPGTYVALEREWRPGDRIDVSMPMSFRVTRTIDDPNVQSLFYGPTLLALQAPPAGTDLASGLIGLSLFRSLKLDGDLGAALAPVPGKPLHFTLAGHTLAPFHVADPQPGETQPYHMYFRREEPTVAFGSVDAGVKNAAGEFGLTFLDDVWAAAPFASHGRFVARVQRVADEWARAGRLSAAEAATVVAAAKRAEADLRV